jgi:TolB-like protein/Flp pilus assembly protein TadD
MSNATLPFQVLDGGFELDRRAGELRKNGIKINLPGQLLQLLALLMERPGQVVTREEIRSTLWSGSFVNFDDSINSAIKRLRQTLQDSSENPQYIETLPGHGYRFSMPTARTASIPELKIGASYGANSAAQPRLAVLPFQSLSGSQNDEYIVDGLTDALTTTLAKIPRLHVKPRSSVTPYKNAQLSLRAIGRKLKVDMELVGTVVRSGNRVRVSAQLLNVATEEHLWVESYDHEFRDALAFQNDMACAIAGAVLQKLSPQRPLVVPTSSGRRRMAYEAYLRGHRVSRNFTEDGLRKALQYWNKAVQQDSEYAKAYACLAETYNMLGILGLLPAPDAVAKARDAALKALEVDDTLSEAHNGLACTMMLDWDWAGAEHEFKRAMQLDPNLNASNPCHYGEFLMAMGRHESAIEELERLQESQPLSVMLGSILGWLYYGNRSYDRAIRQHQRVLAIEPQFALAHMCLGMEYSQKSRHPLAIEECRKARLLGGSRLALGALGCAHAMAGDRAGAIQTIEELSTMSRSSYVPPYTYAVIYAALNEKEAAFEWLQRACDVHDTGLICMNWDPRLDHLRSDARFQVLLNRVGLKEFTPPQGPAAKPYAPYPAHS